MTGDSAAEQRVEALSEQDLLQRLSEWPISGIGMHPGGSNYVFVVRLSDPETYDESAPPETSEIDDDASIFGIYKPQSGERPLRDFPGGTLHSRERAAYLVSRQLGWPRIPPISGVGLLRPDLKLLQVSIRSCQL